MTDSRLAENTEDWDKWVTQPLEGVLGLPLQSVTYFALRSTFSGFDAENVNESDGAQGIHLAFDGGGEVELDWAHQDSLRDTDTGIYFHLVARPASAHHPLTQENVEDDYGLVSVNGTDSRPWKTVIGEALTAVTVWAIRLDDGRKSPQAVTFAFASDQITVAVGQIYTDETAVSAWTIGDGDDVLLFDGELWERLRPHWQDRLVPVWHAHRERSRE